MTATEASRSFKKVLDEAERGETIVVTRGGKEIATIGPAPEPNGAAVIAFFQRWQGELDADWARDIEDGLSQVENDTYRWLDD